jgi:TolB-like protein/Tfp pilus assembly protein PilF
LGPTATNLTSFGGSSHLSRLNVLCDSGRILGARLPCIAAPGFLRAVPCVGRSGDGGGTELSETPEDPLQDGDAAAASGTAHVTVPAHGVESAAVADPWARLKEHKVAQWTLAYGAFAYALLHGATLLSDALEWPHVIVRVLALLLIVGVPIVAVLAWYHGVRALKRVSGSELILITLLLVIGGSLMWLYPHTPTERAAAVVPSKVMSPTAPATTAVFAPPAHSIAVLPFVNMSADAKQEYFSDGITEELLNSLSRLNDLQVAARTSSFSFKGKDVDVATIARKLNVGAVLEGSVRRAGNTVRITVQLINAVSGFHIWSQTYDRNLTDILKLQADVATSVAQQLEVKLVGDEAAKIELGGTKNPEAYDAYLRGMQLNRKVDSKEADYRKALAAFDYAISLDPNFAAAYARRASTLDAVYYTTSDVSTRIGLNQQARIAAERAVALAPQLGEAHHALAITYVRGAPDLTQASREFNRSLALAPGSAWVQVNTGWFYCWLGHFDSAVAAARRAVSLDPQNVRIRGVLGQILVYARRYSEAQVVFHDAQVLAPDSHDLEAGITSVLLASGQFEKARKSCEASSTPLDDGDRHFCLALVYHALSREADAGRELEKFKATDGDTAAFLYAEIYAQWGDKPAAMHWLGQAEQLHDAALVELRVDPFLDPIRNEPQWKAIAGRLNFPP